MVVVLATAMCVGVTSCSKDNDKPIVDDNTLIIGKWKCAYYLEEGFFNFYRIEFNADATYYYENPKLGSGEGNYRIYETIKNQKVTVVDEIYNSTLFKMHASGSNIFDQIWVYHYGAITVEFYSNNERLPDKLWVYSKEH